MLRERLEAACDHVTVQRNMELVETLATEFPHTIVALPSSHDLGSFTCLVHVLGFTGQEQYFAVWLLKSGSLMESDAALAEVGSIVMYFDNDGVFTHVGLLSTKARVQSKWGTLGFYEHGLFEVPANYGDTVRYFRPLTYDQAIELFYDFAEENGVEFE
jgi:hypothetical protein